MLRMMKIEIVQFHHHLTNINLIYAENVVKGNFQNIKEKLI